MTGLSLAGGTCAGLEQLVQGLAPMVRLSVAIPASARNSQELLEAFRFVMRGTRFSEGCVGCSAWIDPDLTVHYIEEWATEAYVRDRIRSERFTAVLAVLESSKERPSVHFDFVTATRGLDYVAEIRGGQDS